MTGDLDPIIAAFSNALFLAAYDNLTHAPTLPLILDDIETRFPGYAGEATGERVTTGERADRPGDKLHELLGDVLKAEAGNRHNPLTQLAQYYAHRLPTEDDLRTTMLGFMEGREYAHMTEGRPSEFDKIVESAWAKARAWKSRARQEDIADAVQDRGGDIDPNELTQPPRVITFTGRRQATEHHLYPVVQRYVSNIIAGPGGSNKTAFAVLLALATVAERPDLLFANGLAASDDEPLWLECFGPVLVLDLDGQPGTWQNRLEATMRLHGITADDLKHKVHIYDPRRQDNQFFLVERDEGNPYRLTQGREYLKMVRWIKASGEKFALVILDTFGRAHPFPMVDDIAARQSIANADRLADYFSLAVVIVSHTAADVIDSDDLKDRKRKGLATGSTALENTARSNSGMLPMGLKDASKRGIADTRVKSLVGLTVRKANDAPEGGWFWFEKEFVELTATRRDGKEQQQTTVALKRAYHVGAAPPATAPADKADPQAGERRFMADLVRCLQGQGQMSITAAADRYIAHTPARFRVAGARSTVRDRLGELPLNSRVDMGGEGVWFVHVTATTQKRKEIWTDAEETAL